MTSRKSVVGLVAAGMLLAGAGAASAGSAKHSTLPDPGGKSCAGQTRAYVAQTGTSVTDERGVGNVAEALGISVPLGQDLVAIYCATGIPVLP